MYLFWFGPTELVELGPGLFIIVILFFIEHRPNQILNTCLLFGIFVWLASKKNFEHDHVEKYTNSMLNTENF